MARAAKVAKTVDAHPATNRPAPGPDINGKGTGADSGTLAVAEQVGSGKLSHASMNHILKGAGATVDHVGGTLPPIAFVNVGDAFLLRYVGREEATAERDFSLIHFDVLDPSKFIQTKSADESKLYKGSIAGLFAIDAHFSPQKTPELVGSVFKVTYLGSQKSKTPNRNDFKMFAIEAVTFNAKAKR